MTTMDREQHYDRRDLAEMRGFDPNPDDLLPPAQHLMPAPGVDAMTAFAAEVEAAREAAHAEWCGESCGERCDTCQERMCATNGPEPRACGLTCGDCPCSCMSCEDQRRDLRAELEAQIEREAS